MQDPVVPAKYRPLVALAIILFGWFLFFGWLVPQALERAQQNPAAAGRRLDAATLEKTRLFWQDVFRTGAVLIAAVGLFAWFVGEPSLRSAVARRHHHDDVPTGGLLRLPRWLVVNTVIGVMLFGSVYDIGVAREHWPFSNYSMYAGVQSTWFSIPRVYGVTEHGDIPLPAEVYFKPFDESRLYTVMHQLSRKGKEEQFQLAVQDLLDRYERRRQAGEHAGPPLRGLRVYRLVWELRLGAINADRPDRMSVIHEWVRPAKEGT